MLKVIDIFSSKRARIKYYNFQNKYLIYSFISSILFTYTQLKFFHYLDCMLGIFLITLVVIISVCGKCGKFYVVFFSNLVTVKKVSMKVLLWNMGEYLSNFMQITYSMYVRSDNEL